MQRQKNMCRPMVEGLERRDVMSSASLLAFCQSELGQRVGGGECAHLASEGLRATGEEFEFSAQDYATINHGPSSSDYIWGNLTRVFDATSGQLIDSNPGAALQPGDVLQYYQAKFSNGTVTASRHTSIVAQVDSQGLPTMVYEQNFNGHRYVTLDSINLMQLTAGWVRAYRPVPFADRVAPVEFTVVNNTTTQQAIALFGSPSTLDVANTAGSYLIFSASGSGTLSLTNGASVQFQNDAGYEVYITSTGNAGIRPLVYSVSNTGGSTGTNTGGNTGTSPTLTVSAPTFPNRSTYFTIRDHTALPVTFTLHGSGRSYTLRPGQVGTFVATNLHPYVSLSNGHRYALANGNFDIYIATNHQLAFHKSTSLATYYTIRDGTRSAVTFTLHGSGRSYTLKPGQIGTYIATNRQPYVQLSTGRAFYVYDGNFEMYNTASGQLSFRWK
jgi:archaellum component FlaG (FlaF/FlaG flagellin family)